MPMIDRYRTLYEYEKDCNQKMLAMLDSVPEARRSDPRFQQSIFIADHLAACREFWLDCMSKGSSEATTVWNEKCDLSALRSRFAAIEPRWTDYLARLDDSRLEQEFEFTDSNESFRLPIGVQIEHLVGHAAYHRGQIALLVNELGGEVVLTDYEDWWRENHSE